jgi:SAM-dependent methyltransferase
MYNYHTFYLNEDKRSIEKWDFDKTNPIHLIGDYDHNLIASELLSTLSNIATDKSIIDVGCRDGFYSFLFEKISNNVASLDIDNRETRQYVHNFLNSKSKFILRNFELNFGAICFFANFLVLSTLDVKLFSFKFIK